MSDWRIKIKKRMYFLKNLNETILLRNSEYKIGHYLFYFIILKTKNNPILDSILKKKKQSR
jgi:hypothetical protein